MLKDNIINHRFWQKVKKTSKCWLWISSTSSHSLRNVKGYGSFNINGKAYYAHRLSYEDFSKLKIKKGMVVDHLCRNTLCVNPQHLELVTNGENIRRGRELKSTIKTQKIIVCKNNHELSFPTLCNIDGNLHDCISCNLIRTTNWFFKKKKGCQRILSKI